MKDLDCFKIINFGDPSKSERWVKIAFLKSISKLRGSVNSESNLMLVHSKRSFNFKLF